jgi:high-affinity iron transporter
VEGKVLTPTLLTWAPEVPALGIYPYWQSLLPQAVLVIAALVSLAVILRQRTKEAVEGGGSATFEGRKG